MNADDLRADLVDGTEKFVEDADDPPNARMTCDGAVAVIARDWLLGQVFIPLPPAKEDAH